jgi:hypothetical protein
MLSKQTSTTTRTTNRQFYVGVEFAYADQFGELKALVDKVKDYTNLFVMGSVGLSLVMVILMISFSAVSLLVKSNSKSFFS